MSSPTPNVDHLLAQADRFVGQGGQLVEGLAAAVRQLRERIVTVDLDGRTITYDKVAECEASLDWAHGRIAELEAAETHAFCVAAGQYEDVLAVAEEAVAYIDTFRHTRPDRGKVAGEFAERLRRLAEAPQPKVLAEGVTSEPSPCPPSTAWPRSASRHLPVPVWPWCSLRGRPTMATDSPDRLLWQLKRAAVDTGVTEHRIPSGPGTPYLVGDFEDAATELGWRVLAYDVDENDWGVWPAATARGTADSKTAMHLQASGHSDGISSTMAPRGTADSTQEPASDG